MVTRVWCVSCVVGRRNALGVVVNVGIDIAWVASCLIFIVMVLVSRTTR